MTLRKSDRFSHTLSLRVLPVPLLVCLASLAAACGPSEVDQDQAREEIRAALMDYLPRMAEAYRTGDVDALTDYTTQKERAILSKHISDLATQGRSMDTELLDLTIEDVNLVSYSSAYVTTTEHWNVKSFAVGTDQILGQDERQPSRVRYQLERRDDRWVILARNRDPSLNS